MQRIVRNIGWLLGGKGFAAVCSIIYLAILARSLGLKGFGHFSLIVGTAQALAALTGFQTWRVVVRYGVAQIHRGEWARFGRLIALCGGVDVISALAGCAIAAGVIYGFTDTLGLNPAYIDLAFVYCCVSLIALTSVPSGVIRTVDRFDVMIYVESIPTVLRLIAAVAIWLTEPTIYRFLFAWGAIALIEAAAYWIMARRLAPEAFRGKHLRRGLEARAENPGIGHFLGVTFAGSSLDALVKQGPLLLIGAVLGTRAAGLFRMASQLAQAMGKLSTLITRAVYPEVARAHVTLQPSDFRRLVVRISLVASIAGAVVVSIALIAGGPILTLIGGEDFARAGLILVPLTIGASFDLASVAFEPVLHSTGHARYSLLARVVAALTLALGLALFIFNGPASAAWAVAIAGATGYAAMGGLAYWVLRQGHFAALEPGTEA